MIFYTKDTLKFCWIGDVKLKRKKKKLVSNGYQCTRIVWLFHFLDVDDTQWTQWVYKSAISKKNIILLINFTGRWLLNNIYL